MCLTLASLNSGSNGNSYYVGDEKDAVLIDAGLSCRETEKRMRSLGLSMKKVRGVFISHEHSDHINGLQVIVSKYDLPCYANQATAESMKNLSIGNRMQPMPAGQEFRIGNLIILPFSKNHDAADPQSFIIYNAVSGITAGVFTDIGTVCDNLVKHFKRCHAAFLEANYDEEMLDSGKYPYYLKKRISGEKGHLSNTQALQLFLEHRPDFMSHLILSHMSAENNCPDKARGLFLKNAGSTVIDVAPRTGPSPVYKIMKEEEKVAISNPRKTAGQLSLF